MRVRYWQDPIILLLGAWLFFAPFWMHSYANVASQAVWNSYICGALLIAASLAALFRPARWLDALRLVIGLWLLIAPFVLPFMTIPGNAVWSHYAVGVLVSFSAFAGLAWRKRGSREDEPRRSAVHQR